MPKPKCKTRADPNEMIQDVLHYTPDDLAANAEGYLGDRQRKVLQRLRIDHAGAALFFALFALFTLWFGFAYFPDHMAIFWLCAGVMVIGTGILGLRLSRLTQALRHGEIAAVEGRAELRIVGGGTYAVLYQLRVGSQKFPVQKDVFLSFRNGELYRVYYVPHSKTLLGAEVIEQDHPFEEREEYTGDTETAADAALTTFGEEEFQKRQD